VSSKCWCDDKSQEPCSWPCDLMRDHTRLREAAQEASEAEFTSERLAAMDRLRAVLALEESP
jgi:hypothetical protein